MSNAPGLRDQRIRLYAPADRGSDGYVHKVYVFDAERWGRLDESRTATSLMQERLQTRVDAVVQFADEVEVPINGVVIDVGPARAWWVRGIYGVRKLRRVIVALERISDERFRALTMYDSPPADGTHVVNPPEGATP